MIARALACLLLSTVLCLTVQARDYRYSDAHLHYVDFFRRARAWLRCSRPWTRLGSSSP